MNIARLKKFEPFLVLLRIDDMEVIKTHEAR
jgi:hypothetical protein